MIGGYCFRSLFRPSGPPADLFLSNECPGLKDFIVIGPFFPQQFIGKRFFRLTLYDLLQDSLAIKKELFMLDVVHDKSKDKLFCISKTTVQIYGADERFHGVRYD